MGKKVIYLSAGHSGPKENGATSKLLNEKVAAAELVRMVAEQSRMIVGMKTRIEGLSLGERVKEANSFCGVGNGVAVEIHFNAGGGAGAECVISNNASAASKKIAAELVEIVSMTLDIKSRGVKKVSQGGRSKLAFVDDTTCPAVILEVCFVDNEVDCKRYLLGKSELAYALAGYFDRLYV